MTSDSRKAAFSRVVRREVKSMPRSWHCGGDVDILLTSRSFRLHMLLIIGLGSGITPPNCRLQSAVLQVSAPQLIYVLTQSLELFQSSKSRSPGTSPGTRCVVH